MTVAIHALIYTPHSRELLPGVLTRKLDSEPTVGQPLNLPGTENAVLVVRIGRQCANLLPVITYDNTPGITPKDQIANSVLDQQGLMKAGWTLLVSRPIFQ